MHVSLCLCTRVRTTTVVPEESLENVAATEFKRRSWIFSERGRPWNYTRTYYSRVTSGRGEKNKKRDHCQRSQLYGSSKPPTTNNNGNRAATAAAAEQQQAREDRCEDDETAPHEQSSVPCNERGSSRRALGTEETANGLPQVLTEILRIGKSPRLSPHMSSPSPPHSLGTSL